MKSRHSYPYYAAILLLSLAFANSPATVHADEERAIIPEAIQLGRSVDFAQDIAPILRANCVACHNKTKAEGQLILEDAAAIMEGSSSGTIVVPGKPDESYLYNVAARVEESFMPPLPNEVQAKKLTPREIGLLRQWILEGAKAGDSAVATKMNWQAINSGLNAIYAVDADPFGRFIAAGRAGNVSIYDLAFSGNVALLVDPELKEGASPQQQSHRDYVHSVAFHPNGNVLATSGFQVVKLWEREVSQTRRPVSLPKGKVVTIAGAADGSLAAIQSDAGVIFTTTLENASMQQRLDGDLGSQWRLLGIGGPENQLAILAAGDAGIQIMDLRSREVVGGSDTLTSKPTAAAWLDASSRIVALTDDGVLHPFTLNTETQTLEAGESVSSERGVIKQIVAANKTLLSRVEGSVVELLDADSMKLRTTIQSKTPNADAAISPDAERVITVSPDGVAELWDGKDGKLIAALTTDLTKTQTLVQRTTEKAAREARVTVVKAQIKEDEKRVTEQQASLKKAQEDVKKTTEAVGAAKKKLDEEMPKVAAAQKASDDRGDDEGLKKKLEQAQKALQTAKDALMAAKENLQSAEKGVELSNQAIGRAKVRVGERKQLLASVEAEAKVATEAHATALVESKASVVTAGCGFSGNKLIISLDANGASRVWDAADGTAVDVFPTDLHASAPPAQATSVLNALLVQDQVGRLSTVVPFCSWKLARRLGPQNDRKKSLFADRVLSLAFSPDGSILAAGGGEASRSGELTLWNVADGTLRQRIQEAHSDTVYGVEFSRDGKRLASAAADKFVKVFDVASGEHVRSYEGHTHHVMDVSWKGDGTRLISAGADNAIKVWDVESGEQTRTISTYSKQVTALSFIGMEDEFISCSGDKRVFRHRAANGGTVREFKGCPDYVYCSTTTNAGDIVAAGCEDGVLRVWNGKDGKEIAKFAP